MMSFMNMHIVNKPQIFSFLFWDEFASQTMLIFFLEMSLNGDKATIDYRITVDIF